MCSSGATLQIFKNNATFKSFEYKPGRVKVRGEHKLYFPGIGEMRFFHSRPFPLGASMRTVTVIKDVDDWYVSILFNCPDELPDCPDIEDCNSNVSYDLGINKLASLTDGSHIENPKFATNKRTRRRLRIRQRRVNRKVKGARNRAKAGKRVAKVHQKVRNQRNDYQWKAAHKIVDTPESIGRENLNIKGMKSRCKPNPCGHTSPNNRDGEKFICESCGHIDHADTQASCNGQRRLGLIFVSIRRKNLPGDSRKVTTYRDDRASNGKRDRVGNSTSKQLSLFAETENDRAIV